MTPDALIARARSVIGIGIRYKLGAGGMRPDADSPADGMGNCDCSGFTAWALTVSRFLRGVPWYDAKHNGEWLNTDAIVRDAKSPFGFFDQILAAESGCLIVFPRSKTSPVAGHVGIVTEVSESFTPLRVVHCSAGNQARFGSAIQETGPEVFMRPNLGTIFARCAFVRADEIPT